jgi:hypothetical protein
MANSVVINGKAIPKLDFIDGKNGTLVYNRPIGGPFTYYQDKTSPHSETCAAFAFYIMDYVWGDAKRNKQDSGKAFTTVSDVKAFFATVTPGTMLHLIIRDSANTNHYVFIAAILSGGAGVTIYDSNSQGDNIVHYVDKTFDYIQQRYSKCDSYYVDGK